MFFFVEFLLDFSRIPLVMEKDITLWSGIYYYDYTEAESIDQMLQCEMWCKQLFISNIQCIHLFLMLSFRYAL